MDNKICKICGDDFSEKCTPIANCLNIPMEAETKSKSIKITAFHKWLIESTNGDVESIANILVEEINNNQNPLVFELLEATEDASYTASTFIKAANIVKALNNKL